MGSLTSPPLRVCTFCFCFRTLYCCATRDSFFRTLLKSFFIFYSHLLNASCTGICNVFSDKVPCTVFVHEAVPVAAVSTLYSLALDSRLPWDPRKGRIFTQLHCTVLYSSFNSTLLHENRGSCQSNLPENHTFSQPPRFVNVRCRLHVYIAMCVQST